MSGNQSIHLALGVHNHLPVGTPAAALEEIYQHAYFPFLKVLAKHPKIKVSMHYSGPLLHWLLEKHPEYTAKLKTLNNKNQIELLTGGYYEPIIAAIPDRDKTGQIGRLTKYIEEHFTFTPKGMWLAERVWEPHLPKSLVEAGVEFTFLDENHFRYAGIAGESALKGYYVTEEQGQALALFPISPKLHNAFPRRSTAEILEILQEAVTEEGHGMLSLFSDGEIFGMDAAAHKALYDKNGLDKFFEKIAAASWIKLTTFSEYRKKFPPLGRVYIPACSYPEMTEWALQTPLQKEYLDLLKTSKKEAKLFLHGGLWRNFLIKYPEANNLHKKQLYVSHKVEKVKELDVKTHALEELWRGQTNDAYWHGNHGGLYQPHLRSSVYQSLLKSESLVDTYLHRGGPWLDVEITDYDKDLMDEILVSTDKLNLYLRPAQGGQLFELDYKARACNYQAVMSRYRDYEKTAKSAASGKEAFDWYPRYSLIDHFLGPTTTFDAFARANYKEQGDFINSVYHSDVERSPDQAGIKLWRDGLVQSEKEAASIRVEKRVVVPRGLPHFFVEFHLTNNTGHTVNLWYAPEFSLSLLSPNEPGSGIIFEGRTVKFSDPVQLKNIGNFTIKDTARKTEIQAALSKTAPLWCFPLETSTKSNTGFERHFQGTVFLPHWQISLGPRGTWKTVITLTFKELP